MLVTTLNRLLVGAVLLWATLTWPPDALGGQFTLTWVPASGNELGFSVERSVGIGGTFTVLAVTEPGATTYTDDTVAELTTYCYRVQAFDAEAYSNYSDPACGTTAPAALTVALTVNRQMFGFGDPIQVDVAAATAGPSGLVDVYVGSVLPPAAGLPGGCPGGDAIAFLIDTLAGFDDSVDTCLSAKPFGAIPLFANLSIDGDLHLLTVKDFFGFSWPLTTPGDYTFFVYMTPAGTGDVIALGTATVSYAP